MCLKCERATAVGERGEGGLIALLWDGGERLHLENDTPEVEQGSRRRDCLGGWSETCSSKSRNQFPNGQFGRI